MNSWERLNKKVQELIEYNNSLRSNGKVLEQRLKSIEMEFEALKSLRAERDILRSEKEAVKQKVQEMVDELEQVEL